MSFVIRFYCMIFLKTNNDTNLKQSFQISTMFVSII